MHLFFSYSKKYSKNLLLYFEKRIVVSDFIIYIFIVIIGVLFVVYLTQRKDTKVVQSKAEKRVQIVAEYKNQIKINLENIGEDKQKRVSKKSELLKKFSDELSRNIFFDNSEIRDIIMELAKES
jgi:flagellar basal body-associated protein FliL